MIKSSASAISESHLSPEKVKKWFEKHQIQKVKIGGFDIDGIFRGKYVSIDKFLGSILEKGLGFCDVIFGWDSQDELYSSGKFTGWHSGYPDLWCQLDLSTLRLVPWENSTALFILDYFEHRRLNDETLRPLSISPRQVLKRIIERAEHQGFQPEFAFEFEFFIFMEDAHSLREKRFHNLKNLSPGMFGYSLLRAGTHEEFLRDVLQKMSDYGVGIEGLHTETGPGVYEIALTHHAALKAADEAALFKSGMKELAKRHGYAVTFMAKWNMTLPGTSGHLHQSLWDQTGQNNLFSDPSRGDGLSPLCQKYLAGQLALMPEFTVLFAPNINSYKRLVENTWAPTRVSWGFENRTTALRLINSSPKATRIEHRLPGGDTNPYLAMAAALASGIHGIEKNLEPPEPCKGNAYAEPKGKFVPLPRSLEGAVRLFGKSEAARDFFGDEFVEHYLMTRKWECEKYQRAVTDWELSRYFEII